MMHELLAIVGTAVGVAIWGMLMVRRARDKAELGMSEGCEGCSAASCHLDQKAGAASTRRPPAAAGRAPHPPVG
ncbi:MAG: hypothetical protein D6798_04845 [Deltaproteobacteria bacterium]|nr:MAG: hypothetical protein D6798_04845 [Deltaproteobacteria bacterium]